MTTPLLIVISLILIIVGFILALLISPLLGLDNKSPKEDKPHEEPDESVPSQTPPLLSDRSLRIGYDAGGSRILIEMDGKVYDSFEELTPEQRRFLASAASRLAAWMNRPGLEPEFQAPPPAQPSLLPIKAEMNLGEAKPASLERNLADSFLRTLQPSAAKTPPQLKSLAAQVDDVLQEKLPGSGLSHYSIHLVDLPNYGMSVQVDREQYPGIDAVPDEAVRKLIREAVEEWKRRSSLGRS